MRHYVISAILLILTPFHLVAANGCMAEPYRQFDFWIGNWVVISANGAASTSQISMINDGCTLLEEYQTKQGFTGKSLTGYDASTDSWHQTWMDNSGLILTLDGKLIDNAMVLSGSTRDKQDKLQLNRITWRANPDGTVRQHWQVSMDQGKTWATIFDGVYHKS